jgi:tetratricopeptide (TPR) repeat protein
MIRSIALALALLASTAFAQDLAAYNKGLSAYNSNNYEDAARNFFEVTNTTTDNDLKLKAEYYLASSFQKSGLPFTAFIYFTPIVKAGPSHPFHTKAVEAFISLQEQLNDDYLIPSILNNNYDKFNDAWATLPLEVLARINYLIGRISHRKGLLDDARQFLEAVPDTSGYYARAQYLLGITLADPRFTAADDATRRRNLEKAIDTFQGVLKIKTKQVDYTDTQQLTYLALGRTNYNAGEFQKSVEWYEKVPRFSKYWDQSLFENGFARFRNEDLGGGLGSLQGLYAPQFAGAFQPESWILTSTIYYFQCLFEESKASLAEFEKIYLPMSEKLKPLMEGDQKDLGRFYALVAQPENDKVPRAVLNWVRSNERMLGLFDMLTEIEKEKATINANQAWRSAKLSSELTTYLDQNKGTLEQVAGNFAKSRLLEAYRTVKGFGDQAEIIRFEIAKAEKELAETGVDTRKKLDAQTLYRPHPPSENWNYWKFQGEFWRDEIGYYQYTLKSGCPVTAN